MFGQGAADNIVEISRRRFAAERTPSNRSNWDKSPPADDLLTASSMSTLHDDMPPKNATRSHDLVQGAMLLPTRYEHANPEWIPTCTRAMSTLRNGMAPVRGQQAAPSSRLFGSQTASGLIWHFSLAECQ